MYQNFTNTISSGNSDLSMVWDSNFQYPVHQDTKHDGYEGEMYWEESSMNIFAILPMQSCLWMAFLHTAG